MVLAWNTAVGRKSFEVYEEGDSKVEKIFKEYKEKITTQQIDDSDTNIKSQQEVVEEVVVEQEQKLKPKNLPKGGISAI
jgi:hypothetical protein